MGSSGSKEAGASSPDGVRGTRLRGARVFHSSCLGGSSASTSDDDSVLGPDDKERGRSKTQTFMDQSRITTGGRKNNCCGKFRALQPNQGPSNHSNTELHECGGPSMIINAESGAESSSMQTALARASSRVSRTCSRFSFMPNNISFRLTRAASMGSLGSYSLFSTNHPVSNHREDFDVDMGSSSSVNDFFPSTRLQDPSVVLQVGPPSIPVHVPAQDGISSQVVARDDNSNTAITPSLNRYLRRNHAEIENNETRQSHRRHGAQEPAEGNVRFSRAMSVGRLRDRVLCRTSLSEGIFGNFQEDRDLSDSRQGHGRVLRDHARRGESSDGNIDTLSSSTYHVPATSRSTNSSQDNEVDTPNMREASDRALVEHRTAFLERRRRIRSQVRALQQLGSRFENLSGHNSSCILSGQHRSGRCTCRAGGHAPNPEEDMNTRASISRIVMLAEALFEVLDEIHQQSVVLSSRPSESSIGSVPAPKEIVESMPVKVYTKPQKHQIEEAAQCYICLVEYEEGDCMRILPCHHDFHQPCIDKWLKEIHRVCPLCRGDVCRSGP